MPIALAPRSDNNSDKVDLRTISDSKAQKIGRLRRDLNKLFSEGDAQYKASQLGLEYVDLYGRPINASDLLVLSKNQVEDYRGGCFFVSNKVAYIASPEPENLQYTDLFSFLRNKGLGYKLFVCSDTSLQKILDAYRNIVIPKSVEDDIQLSEDEIDKLYNSDVDLTNLTDVLRGVSTSEIIEIVLTVATKNKASDIHFEAEKEGYVVKLRLDGVLHTYGRLDPEVKKRIESRVKLVSGLKLNVDNVPQDGRFSFKLKGSEVDVRVSMLPSNYGYSIVMRLLGTNNVELKPEALGFRSETEKQVLNMLDKPQGLILTCGPTGSGKTTTLYSFLNYLNDGNRKIVTIEDPIEYKLHGISQTQIDKASGYTFAGALKSILRQDPDVVMVGEIRDEETAKIAVEASLTGHLVLSTLHTNDAIGSISRLLEMGIKGYLLADALSLVIGQRLVRRICESCLIADELDQNEMARFIEEIKSLPPSIKNTLPESVSLKTSEGCIDCNNLRYKGRIGVYEVLTINDKTKELMSEENPRIQGIRKSVLKDSEMVTMVQDGLLKAIDGITDVEEVLRNVV